MSLMQPDTLVRCHFATKKLHANELSVEVFYSNTKDILQGYSSIEKYIEKADKLRSDKFHFDEDRFTYLFSHTLLRLVLSSKINIDPGELSFIYNRNNKPALSCDPLYFNLSHTRDAFAFAICRNSVIGIDLENIDRKVDINSVVKSFFSKSEREYILEFPEETRNRFFLLWTRKESLLKSMGSGIITNLARIEVCREENILDKKLFDNIDVTSLNDYFIYSKRILNNYLSIAVTQNAKIMLHHIDLVNNKNDDDLLTLIRSFK